MFQRLGHLTIHHPWAICVLWATAGIGLTLVAPSWDSRAVDDDINFLPQRCDSVRGHRLLSEAFPEDVFASRAVLAFERSEQALQTNDFVLINRCVAALNQLRQDEPTLKLGRVYSHRDPFLGKRLVSADRHCSLVQVSLGTPFLALQTRATVDRIETCVRGILEEKKNSAPRLLITGAAGVGRDLVRASSDGLERTTLATVILVVVVLLLVYRAPLLALVPLGTIALSVWVALKGLALLTLIPGVYLVNISQVFAIALLYGAGTDYCLFLISRYREELASGQDSGEAIRRSVGHVGGALTASAGTVVWGLGLMGFAEFAKVRCAGPAIALSLMVGLLASLTLTPALLRLFGQVVFWPRRPPMETDQSRADSIWNRVSRLVVARPAMVLISAVLVLAPLAVLGFQLRSDYRPIGQLAKTANSFQGLEVIQRRFPAGETGPITVLLSSTADWTSSEGRAFLAQLSQDLSHLDNVAEVRSLIQPLGSPVSKVPSRASGPSCTLLGNLLRTVQQKADEAVDRSIRDFYLAVLPSFEGTTEARNVTRLDVVLRSDPFAPESLATLQRLQTGLREQVPSFRAGQNRTTWECYGVTVNARDLAEITQSDRRRINVLVLGGIFVILVLLFRRLWLAMYLLLTVLFSYLATLGATALMGLVWSGQVLSQVDWRVPFFLFTILLAVGEDYNILIISRILQERKRADVKTSVQQALARTGGTITSCGLIMAGTLGTLMLAGLGTLVQTGFALALGVLMDTFVVRPFLVPAFVLLTWRDRLPLKTNAVLSQTQTLQRAA